jgi:hypothetical protein
MKNCIIILLVALFLVIGASVFYEEASAKKPSKKISPIRRVVIENEEVLQFYSNEIWKDPKLGKAKLSCSSCHPNGKGLKRGAYPKFIKMAGDFFTLDQMINFCMINKMKAKPIKWHLQKMTGLAYYVRTHSNEPEEGEVVAPTPVEQAPAEPTPAEPEAAEPEAVEPEAAEPEAAEPEAVEPEAVEPEVAEPEAVEPEVVEPEAVEPEAAEPEAVEPEAAKPEATKLEDVNPGVVKPPVVDSVPTFKIE